MGDTKQRETDRERGEGEGNHDDKDKRQRKTGSGEREKKSGVGELEIQEDQRNTRGEKRTREHNGDFGLLSSPYFISPVRGTVYASGI